MDLNNEKSKATQEACSYFESRYPDVNPVDLQMAIVSSKIFKRVTSELTMISFILAHQEEGADVKEESPDSSPDFLRDSL